MATFSACRKDAPPVFRRYMVPCFQRYCDFMHRAGKQCVFHADSDVSGMLNEVFDTGIDVADCFACAPLGVQPFE